MLGMVKKAPGRNMYISNNRKQGNEIFDRLEKI